MSESHRSHQLSLQPLGFTPVSVVWLLVVASHRGALQKLSASKPAQLMSQRGEGQPSGICVVLGTLDTGRTKEHFNGHIQGTWAALEPMT